MAIFCLIYRQGSRNDCGRIWRRKRAGLWMLQLPSPFHRLEHRDLVGIFNVAADRDAHGDARNFHTCTLELLRQVSRGGFAFNRGISGEDDLIDIAGIYARDEVRDTQLFRADAMQRRDGPVEDMEDSVEVFGLLDRGDVGRLFDDANHALVAGWAGAIHAWIDVGDVVAHRAEAQIGFYVAHSGGERLGIVVAGTQDVKSKALSAFRAHAWQLL